jgi:hypothetical protein
MKKGCLITLCLLTVLLIYGFLTAFDPEYDHVNIKQNIGGMLICNSVYIVDHQSWQYDISYKYKLNNEDTIDIGNGTYYAREWNKDEQLIKYKNWLILKTGSNFSADKIIVGSLDTKKWTAYDFTPEHIEKDSLWQALKVHSLLDYCCPETFIDKIDSGQIELHYKFRTSDTLVGDYDQRKIYYRIDDFTGRPLLMKVE